LIQTLLLLLHCEGAVRRSFGFRSNGQRAASGDCETEQRHPA
jgi:hypothetical protein